MEAARFGGREADVAPAHAKTEPAGARLTGWVPADPGPLGLAGFAGTTFVLSVINANAILFADLTGMHIPPPPSLVLPADSDL